MNNLLVLIIEDNPADARLYELSLADSDYCAFSVTIVDSLAKAAEAMRSVVFDVLLLDLNLPDSDGLETLSRLQRATMSPIVVSTGRDDDRLGFEAIQAGAADFLPKGEKSSHTISRVLAYAVERDRLRTQLEESKRLMRANREMAALSTISGSSSAKFTNAAIADRSLKDVAPERFQSAVERYLDVILLAADEKQYKQTIISKAALRKIAEMLVSWRSGPRDVIEMHVTAIDEAKALNTRQSLRVIDEEPRFLLIELLGYLALHYRTMALGQNTVSS